MRDDDSAVSGDEVALRAIDSAEWQAARHAMTHLRESLQLAGLARDVPHLRADVNAFGRGYVEFGRVAPDTAERLAELLRRGLAFVRSAPCRRRRRPDMTAPRGACAQPAGTLAPGVPYARGWAEGRRAAETLAEQLALADLADGFPALRAGTSTYWATV